MTPEAYERLPLAEVVVDDPAALLGPRKRPLVVIEVDGKPVARLPITGARHEVGVGGALSHLHLTLIAGDAALRSRPEIPKPQTWADQGSALSP